MNSPPRRPTSLTLISTLVGLRRQRRQPAVSDSLADAVVEDDVVEDLAFTFVEPAGIEPERRRREPSYPHAVGRGQRAQLRQQAAIHSVAVVRYQVRLVDQHQVSRPEPRGVAPDALHPGENDRRIPFALADARTVDADGRVRPQREQGARDPVESARAHGSQLGLAVLDNVAKCRGSGAR